MAVTAVGAGRNTSLRFWHGFGGELVSFGDLAHPCVDHTTMQPLFSSLELRPACGRGNLGQVSPEESPLHLLPARVRKKKGCLRSVSVLVVTCISSSVPTAPTPPKTIADLHPAHVSLVMALPRGQYHRRLHPLGPCQSSLPAVCLPRARKRRTVLSDPRARPPGRLLGPAVGLLRERRKSRKRLGSVGASCREVVTGEEADGPVGRRLSEM